MRSRHTRHPAVRERKAQAPALPEQLPSRPLSSLSGCVTWPARHSQRLRVLSPVLTGAQPSGSGRSEPGRVGTARGSGVGLTSPLFGRCGGSQHSAIFSLLGGSGCSQSSPPARCTSAGCSLTHCRQNRLEQLLGLSLAPLGAGEHPELPAHCCSWSLPGG